MSEEKTVEILKNAILLEKRGQAFYGKVAEQASGKAVKEFYEMMADEEVKHVKILSDQYKAYQQDHEFTPGEYNKAFSGKIASKVLTEQLKNFESHYTWRDEPGATEAHPLNSVPWQLAFAFCAWDGGRLCANLVPEPGLVLRG